MTPKFCVQGRIQDLGLVDRRRIEAPQAPMPMRRREYNGVGMERSVPFHIGDRSGSKFLFWVSKRVFWGILPADCGSIKTQKALAFLQKRCMDTEH